MLRTVGLPHRQYLEHLGVLAGSKVLRTVHRVNCPLVCIRWTTASALAYRTNSRSLSIGETASTRSISPTTGSVNCQNGGMPPPQKTLPAEILSAVHAVLSRSTDEEVILEAIRTSPLLSEHFQDQEKIRRLSEALVYTPFPHQSLQILKLAHNLGCHLYQNVYECLAFHLANTKQWHTVLSVVSLGKQNTGQTTGRLLNWRTRALAETCQYAQLQGILEEFKEYSRRPTRRTFHLILSGHIRNHNLALAKQCLQQMADAGYPPDPSTHAIVATHYRSLGANAQVRIRSLQALHGVRSHAATAIVNSLMQIHLDVQDLPGTLQLLGLFNRELVDVIYAVTLAEGANGVAGENHYPPIDAAVTTLQPHPNAATFSLFINYMATQANLPGALRILQAMIAAGITPTSGTVVSLMHAFFSAGQGNLAVYMVAGMCDMKKTPFSMFQPLLTTHGAKDELPWVPSGISPTIQIFNALLKGVLRIQGLDIFAVVLRIMHSNNVNPNAATLEILIAHLSSAERANPRTLLRVLRRFTSPTIRPSLRLLHVISSCIIRHQKYLLYGRGWNTTAVKFSPRRQEHRRYRPETWLGAVANQFDPLAGLGLQRGSPHRSLARSILQSLSSRQIKSDPVTIGLRIQHDALIKSDIDAARDVFHTLLARGMHPNAYHFSALMEGLTRSGDLDGATDILRSAERAGIKPNVIMFTIIIVGHARQGNPDMAVRAFQQMTSAGVKPDVPAIDAVVSAFFAVGAYTMAKNILISLWPHIQPFPSDLRHASLEDLICHFRRLHQGDRAGRESLNKQSGSMLQGRLKKLHNTWKRSLQRQDATSRSSFNV